MPPYNFLVWQWCVRLCKSGHLHSRKPYYALLCFPDILSTDIKLSLHRYNLLEEYWTPNLHLPLATFLRIPTKDWDEYSKKSTQILQLLLLLSCLTYPLSYTTTFSLVVKRPKENFKHMTNVVFSESHPISLSFTVSSCPRTRGMQRLFAMTMGQGRHKQKLCLYVPGNSEVLANSVCWWQGEGYYNLSVSRTCDQHLKFEKVSSAVAIWQWSGWK